MTYPTPKNLLVTISPTPYSAPLLIDMVPESPLFLLGIDVDTSNPNGVALVGKGGAGGLYTFTCIAGISTTAGFEPAPGLLLNPDGTITGTPATQGTFSFVAQVEDIASNTFPQSFSITVKGGLTAVVFQPTIGENGVAYRFEFIVRDLTGTTITSGFSVVSGALPDGLVIAGGASNVVSGTPTALAVGTTTCTIRVTAGGATLDIPCSFEIADEMTLGFAQDKDPPNGWGGGAGSWLPSMIRGIEYVADIVISGGVPPYSFTASNLPTGILLKPQNLQIKGKTLDPATTIPFTADTLVIVATDALGATQNCIRAFFIINSQQGRVQPQKNGVDVSGGDGPLFWNFIEGSNVTITTSNDGVNFNITINAGAAITPGNPTAQVGLTAINGILSTYMRSDAAPALNQGIAPTWTGTHTFSLQATFTAGLITGGSSGVFTDIYADAGNVTAGSRGHVRTIGAATNFSGVSGHTDIYVGFTGNSDPPTLGRLITNDGTGSVDAIQFELATANPSFRKGLYLDGIISPSALASGITNNWSPTGLTTCTVVRVTPNSLGSTLTGIQAPTFGSQAIYLLNIASIASLTLSNQSASSTAANRLILGTSTIVLAPGQGIRLWYDTTTQRWRTTSSSTSTSAFQSAIQIQDEGVNQGSAGDATTWNFTGAAVTASVSGSTATVAIDAASALAPFTYGDGSDGSFVLDGTNTYPGAFSLAAGVYTQLKDLFIQDMTITNSSVWVPNNWRWSIAGTLDAHLGDTTNGVIQMRGAAGQNASGITQGGRGAPITTTGTLAIPGLGGDGAAGGTGAGALGNQNQQNSQTAHMPFAGNGGPGGAGGAGATAGGVSRTQVTLTRFPFGRPDYNVMVVTGPATGTWKGIGAGNGGCGGSAGGGNGAGNNGGGGGGGGAAGGTVWGAARTIVKFTGVLINISGQLGGNGGTLTTGTNRGGGGAGAGGGGGWAILTFSVLSGTGTMTIVATGGNGGTGGSGFAGGANGTGGNGGDGGLIQVANVPAGTFTSTIGSPGGSPTGTTGGTGGACTYTFP